MKAAHRPRRRRLIAPLTLSLATTCCYGAVVQPRADAAPATGEVAQTTGTSDEPLRGNGIVWRFAPWRMGGTASLDLRTMRTETGQTTRQTLLLTDFDMASHLWQPWFVQVRLGVGFVAASSGGDSQTQSQLGSTLTGHAAVSVFPASRFPFELRADLSDSRSGGVGLGNDYSSRRLSVSQSWRPERGTLQLQFQGDYSEIIGATARDTLGTLVATAAYQARPHSLDMGLNHSSNERSDSNDKTRLSSLSARHSFHPTDTLNVETLATQNETHSESAALSISSEVRQVAALVSWQGKTRLWEGAGVPIVAATARWVQVRSSGNDGPSDQRVANVSLGLSQELSPTLRGALSGSASQLQSSAQPGGASAGLQAAMTWSPASLLLAGWRYGPTASINASTLRDMSSLMRRTVGVQASHSLSRDFRLDESSALSLGLTQSGAALKESLTPEMARAVAHAASLGWQRAAETGGQSYGSLSYTTSRTLGGDNGRSALVNLQFTHRTAFSRYDSLAANLTLQAANNSSTELDAFTGARRETGAGWQRSYSGGLSYENQRAFGIPRLRHTVMATLNSHPLERRALGDIDAPRERISQSLESRLDFMVGRLDARLSVRAARADGRNVVAMQARVQRRF